MMKCAAPQPRRFCLQQKLEPALHLVGRLIRKCHQDDILGRYSALEKIGDAIDKGSGLAAAGARKDKAWPVRLSNNFILLRVQFLLVFYPGIRINEVCAYGIFLQ